MKLNNKYYILRHGEAVSNVKQIMSSWPETFKNPLSPTGRKQIAEAAKKLKNLAEKEKIHINVIIASDLLRTKQTANIVARALKLKVNFDERLREVGFGNLNGRSTEELLYLGFERERLGKGLHGSESYQEVLDRVSDFLHDIDNNYKGATILIVSHQCPLWILENYANGFSLVDGLENHPEEKRIGRGELRELNG